MYWCRDRNRWDVLGLQQASHLMKVQMSVLYTNMILERPFEVITTSVDGDVLAVLGSTGQAAPLTIAEIHELIGARSEAGVRNAAYRLAKQGILTAHRAGRTTAYTLNDQHLAADAVRYFANIRRKLFEMLRHHVASWRVQPVFATVFGSAATKTMTVDSDIDIFIVRSDDVEESDLAWTEQISGLKDAVISWTGNAAEVLEVSEREVVEMRKIGDQVIADVESHGIPIVESRSFRAGAVR